VSSYNLAAPNQDEDFVDELDLRGCQRIIRAAMRLGLLIFAAAMAWGHGAQAQGMRVQGVVRDRSGASVPDAQVKISGNSYSAEATTDTSGAFSFDGVTAPSGTIEVTAKGFQPVQQTWTAPAGAAAQIELVLRPLTVSQTTIVTAARTATPLEDSPLSAIQLTRDDLDATPALTLDDSLRQIPGFSLFRRSSSRTANPTTLGVSLRGLGASGASRVLVLEDGIPLNDPFGAWIFWDRVPTESAESVEISQGGASSLYGSDALGGVLQFITRPAQPAGLSLETSYGNQNSADFSVSGGGQAGKWESTFAGEAFQTDGYNLVPEAYRGTVDTNANSEHGSADVMVGRKIGDSGSEIFARGWYLNDSRNNGTRLQFNNISLGEGALGANLQLGSAGTLTLRFYGEAETYHQSFSKVAFNQNTEALTDLQAVPAQGVGGSAVWSKTLGSRQTLVAGFDEQEEIGHSNEMKFSSVTGNHTVDTFAGGHQLTTGVFGEDLIQIAPKWLLNVSARYDHWSNFDAFNISQPLTPSGMPIGTPTSTFYPRRSYDAFDPRATLLYQINDHVSWSASVYRAFRAPTLNELYRSFQQGNTLTEANANLRAERLTGGETGVDVNGLNQHIEIRGVFFFNEIIDPIANVPLASPPNTQRRQNLGRTSAPGFEVDAIGKVTSQLQFSGGYQYVDSTVISAPGVPALVGTWVQQVPHNVLTFQTRYTNPSLVSFTVEGRMIGKQLDTTGIFMGSFFTLDAMASRELGRGVEIFAAAENLLNEKYETAALNPGVSPAQLGLPVTARFGLRFDVPTR
jgi:outer membrane receptor protein involved in Fe transport